MPGSPSSSAAVAELRLTRPPAAPFPPSPGTRRGTSTCIPSASGTARLIAAVSAGAVAPPARATASATRLPSSSRYRPGRFTAPATCTTSLGAAAAGSAMSGWAGCSAAAPAPASVRPATASSASAAAASTSACRRDTGREGMSRACLRACHGGPTASKRSCAKSPAVPEPAVRATPAALAPPRLLDHEIDELTGDDDRLPRLAAVQVCADALGLARERDQLLLGDRRRHLQPVAQLPVDLEHDLDRLALEQGRIGHRPRPLPQPLVPQLLPQLLR